MDKIIYFAEGSLNSGQTDMSLPHSLGFAPLIFGICAFNSDFSDGRGIPYQYQTTSDFVFFEARASSTDVKVSYNTANGTPAKVYYRICGFESAGSTATIPGTSGVANKFILNTDYNYCKLFRKGSINANTPTTITHNLGYLPQVMAWREANGIISPFNDSDWYSYSMGTQVGIEVTTTSVNIKAANVGLDKVHYRIYYDEA